MSDLSPAMFERMPAGLTVQPRAARVLAQTLRARTAHAFLFSGPAGHGTVEAAQWVAQASLCPGGGGDDCEVCRRVARRVHPDLLWLRAEGTQLAREQIDLLVEQLVRRPFEAAMQVAVIEDADSLSATNPIPGNLLLKTLEEPPGDVLFVLLAQTPGVVLPTIRSRVIEVPFPPLPDARMREYLERAGLADAARAGMGIDAVVRVAQGDIARARDFVEGGPARARHDVVMSTAQQMAAARIEPVDATAALLALGDEAAAAATRDATREFEAHLEQLPDKDANRFRNSKEPDGMEARIKRRARRAATDELREVLAVLSTFYRDLLAVAEGAPETVVAVDQLDALRELSATPAAQRVIAALDAIDDLPPRLTTNVDFPIAVGALCAELVGLAEGRIRSRRTIGAVSRAPQGFDLTLS